MYEHIIKMVTLSKVNRYETKPFWGLVQQVGPWKSVESDRKRASMKDHPTVGGGIGAGGTSHAGHGEWMKFFTPYQIDASGSLPNPSHHAMRSVVTYPVDMKRQTKIGRVKKGLTMAARSPLQSGEKMGMSTLTENVEQGQRLGTAPGQILPDLISQTYGSEASYGLPSLEQTAPFLSEHQIAETNEWMNNQLSRELHREVEVQPKLTVSRRPSVSLPPSRPALSLAQGEKVSFAPSRPRLSVARGETVRFQGIKPMEVARGYLGVEKGETVSLPGFEDDSIQIDQPSPGPLIKVEEPVVPTFKPPALNLALSESFLKSIADYEEGKIVKRKQKMEQGKESKDIVPVPVGEGKKLAMSAKALGKMAEKRGITSGAKAAGIIPEKPKSLIRPIKITPSKKSKIPYQRVTEKTIKALRKRLGHTKIKTSLKKMKETNIQYKIFKAANEQWLKEK